MVENTPVIRLENIRKSFGGTLAVNNVSLAIYPGEVHGIVGENGAGKSTLMRIISGFYPDYEGEIYIKNQLVQITNPSIAQNIGIALVHQELSLVPELTVAENIYLGREFRFPFLGLINKKNMEKKAGQILSDLEANISPKKKICYLSIAKQQLVEIAKGVSMESKVLILDEPTSSLTAPEIADLFRIIKNLKESNTAILYISHKLPEIFEITDKITVLRDGEKVDTKLKSWWNETSLVKAMVGREISTFYSNTHAYKPEKVALRVKHITRQPYVKDVSFEVYKGEVLGIYGLVGAGRTELAELLTGFEKKDSGEIYINDCLVKIDSVIDAIKNEIALVPEDRRIQGLHNNFSVMKNLTLSILPALCKLGLIINKQELDLANSNVIDLKIKIPGLNAMIGTLSGGNQQKVVLGKWLNTEPKILILDDPTRGIDVGAKAEIRKIIDDLAGQGRAIILISSELPEITCMSDRILVMWCGKIIGEFSRDQFNEETLGTYAVGGKSTKK